MKLVSSLVNSVLLYGCESLTIDQCSAKKLEAFEKKSYSRFLGINWKQRKKNEYVWQKVVEENSGNDDEYQSIKDVNYYQRC